MIQLFLNPDLANERLLDLAARQRCLLDLFDGDLDACALVHRQLDLAVGAFPQVSFLRLDELQVVLSQILEQRFESLLLDREGALVVGVLDEWGRGLDSLDVAEEHGVASFGHLP